VMGCAEAAPVSEDMDTFDLEGDVPSGDVTCAADACAVGEAFCGGPYSLVTCIDDGSGCGVLGPPVACALTELCESGACIPFESCADGDMDGYGPGCSMGEDCNDNNASVHPGAQEVCDQIDNNCVDGTDEGCPDPCA